MKRRHILGLIPLLALTACNNQVTTKDIKILTPQGAPAVCFYNHFNDANYETNAVPSNITSMMNANSDKTVVVIDTYSGLNAINNGAPYKLAATITFGNFYICSTGNSAHTTMEVGDKICLFGKNQTPDLIFHYLYGDTYDSSITYVNAAKDAASVLQTGTLLDGTAMDFVFLAQPAVFGSLNANKNASIAVNIQDEYKTKSQGLDMIQASVFIKNTIDKETANEFLDGLKTDIENVISNPNLIATTIGTLSDDDQLTKYGTKAAPAKAVTANGNGMGLGFRKAKDIKANIDAFVSLFGMGVTSEEAYF